VSEHFKVANLFGIPSPARWIWAGKSEECYLRRTWECRGRLHRAEMVLAADDEAEVFVNGDKVAEYDTARSPWGHRGGAVLVDLRPFVTDGKNVLAVRVKNLMLARGFVAEIRLNGSPFLPPLVSAGRPLPPQTARLIDQLALRLDSDSYPEREQATTELVALARKYGEAARQKVQDLTRSDSLEVRSRAERILDELADMLPSLDPPPGKEESFGFGRLSAEDLKMVLTVTEGRTGLYVKHLMAAQVLRFRSESEFHRAVRAAAANTRGPRWERIVPLVSFLEAKPLEDVLALALKANPGAPAGSWAAKTLGRLGSKSYRSCLEAPLRCGYPPTERAAKQALVELGP
jgi:hypothetical protein